LMIACSSDCLDMVQELLTKYTEEHATLIDTQNSVGFTALMFVCQTTGSLPIVEELLNKGADPNIIDIRGKTALMYAIERGYDNIATTIYKTEMERNSSYFLKKIQECMPKLSHIPEYNSYLSNSSKLTEYDKNMIYSDNMDRCKSYLTDIRQYKSYLSDVHHRHNIIALCDARCQIEETKGYKNQALIDLLQSIIQQLQQEVQQLQQEVQPLSPPLQHGGQPLHQLQQQLRRELNDDLLSSIFEMTTIQKGIRDRTSLDLVSKTGVKRSLLGLGGDDLFDAITNYVGNPGDPEQHQGHSQPPSSRRQRVTF